MPPYFSKEDFCQLLQKVMVLELKIHCLEEMNALEDSTCVQMGEKAVRRDRHEEEMEAASESQAVWNSAGSRPKNLSGRIQLLNDDEWPKLQRNYFSPPSRRKKQPQAGIKTTDNSQRNEDRAVFLQNRFTALEEADTVKKMLVQLARISFKGFPNLFKTTKAIIEDIKQEKEFSPETMLRTQFKMELLIYSQDKTYSNILTKSKEKDMVHEDGDDIEGVSNRSIAYYKDNHIALKELMVHLKSYYKIACLRLADQIPLVIRYEMLQQSAVQLQREMLQLLQDKENMEFLLKEDHDIGSKRAALQSRLKRLLEARRYITDF